MLPHNCPKKSISENSLGETPRSITNCNIKKTPSLENLMMDITNSATGGTEQCVLQPDNPLSARLYLLRYPSYATELAYNYDEEKGWSRTNLHDQEKTRLLVTSFFRQPLRSKSGNHRSNRLDVTRKLSLQNSEQVNSIDKTEDAVHYTLNPKMLKKDPFLTYGIRLHDEINLHAKANVGTNQTNLHKKSKPRLTGQRKKRIDKKKAVCQTQKLPTKETEKNNAKIRKAATSCSKSIGKMHQPNSLARINSGPFKSVNNECNRYEKTKDNDVYRGDSNLGEEKLESGSISTDENVFHEKKRHRKVVKDGHIYSRKKKTKMGEDDAFQCLRCLHLPIFFRAKGSVRVGKDDVDWENHSSICMESYPNLSILVETVLGMTRSIPAMTVSKLSDNLFKALIRELVGDHEDIITLFTDCVIDMWINNETATSQSTRIHNVTKEYWIEHHAVHEIDNDKALAALSNLARNGFGFHFVEDESFKKYLSIIAPNYKLPSTQDVIGYW
jgi:hypothetical protein